jgi:hypothetical protein
MRIPRVLAILALLPLAALGGAIENGTWELSPGEQPGTVQFSLQGGNGGHHFNTSSDRQLADFRGLDWTTAAKHDVHFTIARDAGTIDGQGFLQDQRGAGLFTFKSNPQYQQEMSKLGYSIEEKDLFAAAIFDVSLEFARALKALAVRGLDAGKLLAFRIHGVSPEFVKDLRGAGLEAADADKLIAFRIHGVSAEFAGEISHLGYPHAPPDQLIALRIHGVTPEYIEGLRSKGMQNLTLEQLVNLRIHGID